MSKVAWLPTSPRSTFALTFVVPETAGIAVIQLNEHGQPSETDWLLWKSAAIVRLG